MERLDVKNLTAGYGEKTVLKDVSFSLNRGEFVCLIGQNGAGKSTLLNVVSNLEENRIKYSADFLPFDGLNHKLCSRQISFLSQMETLTWDFSIKDLVMAGRFPYTDLFGHYSKKDEEFTEKIIGEFGLSELQDKSVFQVSGGELQKARIARCFNQETPFLFLDEPLSSLDFVYENNLMKLLKEKAHSENKGILISVHNLNAAFKYADRVFLLPKCENIISGRPEEIFNPENLEHVFGAQFEVINGVISLK